MDRRRRQEQISGHEDLERNKEKKKQRTELLLFLEVPLKLQDAKVKSLDKKRAKRDAEVDASRTRGFSEHMNAISGLKEGKKIGKIPATLARLLGLHVMDHPRLYESRGQDPSITMSTSDPSARIDTKSVTVRYESEKGFSVELSEKELRSAFNRLPQTDLEGVSDWITSLFPEIDLTISTTQNRPAGMTIAGGGPAEFQTRTLSGSPKSVEQAFEMYQAFVLIREVSHSLGREIAKRTERVLQNNWQKDRAYMVGEEAYLSDLVEEKAVEAITAFLGGEGRDFMGKVLDVNMILRDDSATPTVSFEDEEKFFGRAVTMVRTIELPPVDLGVYIPELSIKEFDLEKVSPYGRGTGEKMHIQLPSGAQVDISVPYYPAHNERSFENSAKRSLFDVLNKWFAKNKDKDRSTKNESVSLQKLQAHLKTLGLSLEELKGLSVAGQQTRVKKTYRALAMKYHPDRNPDDPDAEKILVKLNAASEFLLKEYGIALID